MRGRKMKKLKNLTLAVLTVIVGLGGIRLVEVEHTVNAEEKNNIQNSTMRLPTLLNSNDSIENLPETINETDAATESTIESEEVVREEDDPKESTSDSENLKDKEKDKTASEPIISEAEEDNSKTEKEFQSRGLEIIGDWQVLTPPVIDGYVEIYHYRGSENHIEIPRELDGKPTVLTLGLFQKLANSASTQSVSVSETGLSNGGQLYGTMQGAFSSSLSNSRILSIDLSKAIAPPKAVSTVNMFQNLINIQTIKLPLGMKSTDSRFMFFSNRNLTMLDLNEFNTSEVTSMDGMFMNCHSLTKLDLRNFDTSSVKSMGNMFASMLKLEELDVSNFDTQKVTSMGDMFRQLESISFLNLGSFDTSNVIDFGAMFYESNNLKIINLSNFILPEGFNVNTIFGNYNKSHPLLVIADDPILLSLKPSNAISIMEMSIEGNGGTFTDGSSKKNFFNSIAITSVQAESLLSDIKQFLADNIPIRSPQTFETWRVTKGTHINEITDIYDLVETNYMAQWKGPTLSSVPEALSFSGKIKNGPMSIKQPPPPTGSNRLIFFADVAGQKNWQITGQLKWEGKDIPNSSLSTTSSPNVYMSNKPDGSNPSGWSGEGPTSSSNIMISTTPTTIVEVGGIPKSNYFFIDFKTISLAIDDGSVVSAGTYSGSINWDFSFTP